MSNLNNIADKLVDSASSAAKTVYQDASGVAKNTTLSPIPALIISSLVAITMFIILIMASNIAPDMGRRMAGIFVGSLVVAGFSYAIFRFILYVSFMMENPAVAGTIYMTALGRDALK